MTLLMTPTEFNQNSSLALRTARRGEDVLIRSVKGKSPAVVLTLAQDAYDPLEAAVISGRVQPPLAAATDNSFAVVAADRQEASQAIANFEAGRSPYEY
jgi:hypothetical protein